MAGSKLFDLFDKWLSDKTQKDTLSSTQLQDFANSVREFNHHINSIQDELEGLAAKLKNTAQGTEEYNTLLNSQEQIYKELEAYNKRYNTFLESQSKRTKVSAEVLRDYADAISEHDEGLIQNIQNQRKFNSLMSSLGESFNFNFIQKFKTEIASLTAIFIGAIHQIVSLNDDLIKLQRQTGGALNAKRLGFDVYGNNKVGGQSLATQAAYNNVSVDEVFQGLQGFANGQVMGLADDLNKSGKALQEFGVQQGRLIKLYGVSSQSIANVTKNMTQLYGIGIKDLNKNLLHGTDVAKQAGVSVNQFFENLSQVSDLVSSIYIRGGFQGLEKLSITLTKLNVSAGTAQKQLEDYKEITDIFEKTNQAVALGLTNYSNNVSRIFAKGQLGDVEGALQIKFASLAKDMQTQGLFDGNGIKTIGLKQLQAAGLNDEEKKSVLRLLQANKNLGISFEKLTGQVKMTAAEQRKVRIEEFKNMTIQEKLMQSWSIFKANFLDPIGQIIGPMLDISLNILNTLFKVLGLLLKPVVNLFSLLGKVLQPVVDVFSWIGGLVDDVSKTSKSFGILGDIVTGVIQAFVALKLAAWAAAKAQNMQSISSSIGGFFNKIPGLGKLGGFLSKVPLIGKLFGKGAPSIVGAGTGFNMSPLVNPAGATSVLSKAGGFLPKLIKGAGIGTVLSLGGDLLKGIIGGKEGTKRQKTGSLVGDTLGAAGVGATIGSVIPGIGTVAGGVIGGIFGLVKGWFSWTKTRASKEDSKEDKMKVAMASIAADPFEIAKNVVNSSRTVNAQESETAQYERLKTVFQPKVQVNNNVGIFNKGVNVRGGGY